MKKQIKIVILDNSLSKEAKKEIENYIENHKPQSEKKIAPVLR